MSHYLLDTNALGTLYDQRLRKRAPRFHSVVLDRIQAEGRIPVASFVFYEARRGLEVLRRRGEGATKLELFNLLMREANILGLDADEGWLEAVGLWAESKEKGINLQEADLLVTATALAHERRLVTADQPLIQALRRLGLEHVLDAHPLE